MARITCAYSSVVFQCEHMPISLSSREITHPIFSVPKKKLISLAGQWAAGKLSPTESYLLYLALLDSTTLIQWRSPAAFTSHTLQIVASNMESLLHIIGKVDVIHHPSFALPQFAISHDTADLSNSYFWIQAWMQNYNDWMEGFREARLREELKEKLDRRESSLEKLINDSLRDPKRFARLIANWAEVAADFPTFSTLHPFKKSGGKPLSQDCHEYWKEIIEACADDDQIWRYPEKDIQELLLHCEENTQLGSKQSHHLFRILREGIKKNAGGALGLGDLSELEGRKTTRFTVLSDESDVYTANLSAARESAPETKPLPHAYAKKFDYIKALLNWEQAQKRKG